MEKINLNEYLASNEYPGRGIAVAMAPDGRQMFIGYFIMGRSENSRNRVFDPVPERGGICTIAADPAKLEDPSLIIYNPVLTLGKTHIVTNGDQTDTIYDGMSRGKSFADSLRTRTFEPDGPNYTPRISAVVYEDGSYQMSILKSADGNGESVQRYFFDYPQPVAGEGHFISTYKHNGNPIPAGQSHAPKKHPLRWKPAKYGKRPVRRHSFSGQPDNTDPPVPDARPIPVPAPRIPATYIAPCEIRKRTPPQQSLRRRFPVPAVPGHRTNRPAKRMKRPDSF